MLNVFVLLNILFALLAFGIYLFSNVAIRRYVAGIRSREDYESDVDGTMTKEEKKKEKEQKVIEAEKVKIGFRETYQEYPARCIVLAILGAILTGINFWYFGITVQAGLYSLFFLFLLMIALIDFDTMEIPPSLNLAILDSWNSRNLYHAFSWYKYQRAIDFTTDWSGLHCPSNAFN